MSEAQTSTADTLSKRGFAEMLGVTPGRVSQHIANGLPVEPNGRIDIERGKAWVRENVDANRRRGYGGAGEPNDGGSRRAREAAEAELAGLKAKKLAGELIDRGATLRAIEARARFERDAWVGWVNRAAPELASATNAELSAVATVLERLVREQLATLAAAPLSVASPVEAATG
jgi:hypothetical protein